MNKKIFVSYKFADSNVKNLSLGKNSTVRDYVTEFENILDSSDHIYKGESDDEDLSNLSDETIWEKLKDRIYDSSVTVVFISPRMKDSTKTDKEQWIPWEISYSLKEVSRKNKNGDSVTSRSNAMIAVVLPDANGSYEYYLESKTCCINNCTTHHTDKLFTILKKNKFNLKDANKKVCSITKSTVWYNNDCSYVEAVKWDDFLNDYNTYIEMACKRQDEIDSYEICKEI